MGAIAKNAAERKILPAYSMLILTNGSGDEEGRTWAVTRRWMYDVGIRTFPWHLGWNLEDATQEVEGRVLETIGGGVPTALVRKQHGRICEYYTTCGSRACKRCNVDK